MYRYPDNNIFERKMKKKRTRMGIMHISEEKNFVCSLYLIHFEYGSKESSTQNERTNQNARTPCIVAIKVKVYFYKLSLLKSRGSFDL
jgi:hypothetical protein